MPQVKLNVKILDATKDAISIIYAACRQCYSPKFAGDLIEEVKSDARKQEDFVRKVVSSGHESPIEHVKFTFAIEGVSRALTHQLVRHRIASFSQQSQRYVKATNFNYIIPPSIEQNKDLKGKFIRMMEEIQTGYNDLLDHFKRKDESGEQVNQDARFLLPQAAETKIVVTMNCRELLHFFEQRCCNRAQWEIRGLALEMLKICQDKLPAVFADAGAKCVKLSYCPESAQFTCKRYPLKEEILRNK
ncbi:MAG: FAD-dependent thymidylate synthase [Candidatus Omnitrophota bacterium]|nr:FAD-dependent thymidylate synthase [Candidatus Omnitrophota bacterium]MBU1929056.1 FAD-dependent thymidylate synthase [Candidatus Omnitrophota bacterium]MBU2034397.1 FAD-dependent thymidylate synthase [Candidatus Omnitrophota bacterium]MBU2258240.1 FAD-dependent thymidylate synthase [Candidatus Omnitrophota bacterium]